MTDIKTWKDIYDACHRGEIVKEHLKCGAWRKQYKLINGKVNCNYKANKEWFVSATDKSSTNNGLIDNSELYTTNGAPTKSSLCKTYKIY